MALVEKNLVGPHPIPNRSDRSSEELRKILDDVIYPKSSFEVINSRIEGMKACNNISNSIYIFAIGPYEIITNDKGIVSKRSPVMVEFTSDFDALSKSKPGSKDKATQREEALAFLNTVNRLGKPGALCNLIRKYINDQKKIAGDIYYYRVKGDDCTIRNSGAPSRPPTSHPTDSAQ